MNYSSKILVLVLSMLSISTSYTMRQDTFVTSLSEKLEECIEKGNEQEALKLMQQVQNKQRSLPYYKEKQFQLLNAVQYAIKQIGLQKNYYSSDFNKDAQQGLSIFKKSLIFFVIWAGLVCLESATIGILHGGDADGLLEFGPLVGAILFAGIGYAYWKGNKILAQEAPSRLHIINGIKEKLEALQWSPELKVLVKKYKLIAPKEPRELARILAREKSQLKLPQKEEQYFSQINFKQD